MERRGATRGEESRGDGGSMPQQGRAGGTRVLCAAGGSDGDGGGEGARSRGGAAGSTGQGGVRTKEAEVRDTPAQATLEDGGPTGLTQYR